MSNVTGLVDLLEQGARRLGAEAIELSKAGGEPESLKGEADAFLLLAVELREHDDPVALLDSLYGMERAATWMANRDEEQAVEFESQGNASASRYHAQSARYAHGLVKGYERARLLIATSSVGREA